MFLYIPGYITLSNLHDKSRAARLQASRIYFVGIPNQDAY